MALVSLPFTFTQKFRYPADKVFAWATNYSPKDIDLMGLKGRRKIERLCDDAILLTDTFLDADGSGVAKKKLVRLYPELLRWTNTHVAGPNRHSQYLYELIADGDSACHLVFTGRRVLDTDVTSARELRAMAKAERDGDALLWKNLAKAMAADLRG